MKIYEYERCLTTDLGTKQYLTYEIDENRFKSECEFLEAGGYEVFDDNAECRGYFKRHDKLNAVTYIVFKLVADTEAGWRV